ncbi:MAG: hypothetical protein FWH05_07115 [Oscillospiraceae bacterium]|nr:hypothetical protein [Oscillospiraceae bacterium]
MVSEKTGFTKAMIIGIIMLGLGVFLIIEPKFFVILVFIAITLNGLGMILNFVLAKDKEKRRTLELIAGVLLVAFGLAMFFGGTETKIAGVVLIEILAAVWLLFTGTLNIVISLKLKKFGVKVWYLILAAALISIAIGIVFIAYPLASAQIGVNLLGVLSGCAIVVMGLTSIAIGVLFKNAKDSVSIE